MRNQRGRQATQQQDQHVLPEHHIAGILGEPIAERELLKAAGEQDTAVFQVERGTPQARPAVHDEANQHTAAHPDIEPTGPYGIRRLHQ
jgi:hypothetical protein